MDIIQAELSVSISELKRNPSAIIEQANGKPVVILNHNRPSAYLVSIDTYQDLIDESNKQQKSLASRIRSRFSHLSAVELDVPTRSDQVRAVKF